MKTVKQLKMELRNRIEDIKGAYRLNNQEIGVASGVTNVTVGRAINSPHLLKAETVEQVYQGCVRLERERIKSLTKRQSEVIA
jgi:hypothetical protein